VLARNFNAAAVKEREDLVKLNQSVERELENLGLTFNRTDPAAFRAAVSRSGYYKQWKETFGKRLGHCSRSIPGRWHEWTC
jgi:hypothetical protein